MYLFFVFFTNTLNATPSFVDFLFLSFIITAMDTSKDTTQRTEEAQKFVMDNVKKLTNALYRVTDLLSDREPLKWTLRNKGVSLYDNLTSFVFIKDKGAVLNESLDSIGQIINVLDLCSKGNTISCLNFEILRREYLALKSFMEGNREDITIGQILLSEPKIEDENKEKAVRIARSSSLNEKNKNSIVSNENQNAKTILSELGSEGRKEKIIIFLKSGGNKTISEISSMFNNKIGLKTVQRDLADLVKKGVISTKGEKRWRVYSLLA